ncbi:hypothetical protein [Salinibius halmophilus]|uniref:hypothetical protein n=1 Tax=Salinibius halmophilus TaxID=1853216 RepID=UPI000E66E5CA|nr:hypothetical protein [Salinibius halmophilus]
MKKLMLVAATATSLAACTSDIGGVTDQVQLSPPTLEITQQNASALIAMQTTTREQTQREQTAVAPRIGTGASTTIECRVSGTIKTASSETADGLTSKAEFLNCNEDGNWSLLGSLNTVLVASGNEANGNISIAMSGGVTATHQFEPVTTELSQYNLNMNMQTSGTNVESTTTMTAKIAYESPEASGTVNMYTKPMVAVDFVDGQLTQSGTYYIEGANGSYISVNVATGETKVNGQVWPQ